MIQYSPVRPRIQVLLDDVELSPEIARTLRRLGAEIELSSFMSQPKPRGARPTDARLVITHQLETFRRHRGRRLLECYDHDPCGTIVLAMSAGSAIGIPSMGTASRAIQFAAGMDTKDLAGRLSELCGLQDQREHFRKAAPQRSRLTKLAPASDRATDDRRLAGMIQRDLLPARLPTLRHAALRVLYRPADEVSGDLYDVVRLDANTVALTVMDATGHDLAAALLASYARRHLETVDMTPIGPVVLEPADVLERLNRALCRANLVDCQFVAAIHAIYDERTGELRWARAGLSYPVIIRDGSPPEALRSQGPVLGMDEDASFESQSVRLRPGDTMLFHSDGLDDLMRDDAESGDLVDTPWMHGFHENTWSEQVRDLEYRFHNDAGHRDDLTLLALTAHHTPATTPAVDPDESLAAVYL